MKRTPQKLKRPENELQPSLKLCERRRKKSGAKFSFSVPLPNKNSASRFDSVSCYFPPADSSFRPQGQYPGGGVLPYMGHVGMCRCEGYGFQAVYSSIGYINQSF